ncbi:hypothetical protein HOD15_01440 [Candidatus Peregrinibacteria bacterium]|nr:hypothetical protein [Candidatus Peregrinibacteria bacterium]
MKLKTNPFRLLVLFVLFFVFLGVVFFGAEGGFGLDGMTDRARGAFKRLPISRDIDSREEESRERGRGGSEGSAEGEGEGDSDEGWWCDDDDPETWEEIEEEEVPFDSDRVPYDITTYLYEDFSTNRFLDVWTKHGDSIFDLYTVVDNGENGDPFYIPKVDAPEIGAGNFWDWDNDNWITAHCLCGDQAWDLNVNKDDLSQNFGGSLEEYCAYVATWDSCQPKVTVSCACESAEGGIQKVQINEEDVQDENGEISQDLVEVYCSEALSVVECDPKYYCENGFDWQKAHNFCFEEVLKMKQNECLGTDYEIDESVWQVCQDADVTYDDFLNSPCVPQNECEEYAAMSSEYGCEYTQDYLEGLGYDDPNGVAYACWNLYGVFVPIDGKGCAMFGQ